MRYLVAYDISSARTRRYAVKWCKQAGLRRMQKSVFVGKGLPNLILELEQQLTPMLGKEDRLCIMPLNGDTWQAFRPHGNNPGKQALSPPESEIKHY